MSSKTKTIYQLMPELIKAVGAVGKNAFNSHQKYPYRSVDDIMAAVNPALVATGVSLRPQYELLANEQLSKGSRVLVGLSLSFFAPDGSCIATGAIGEGKDFGDKAVYKAMAGALKYALLQTLCIPTDEVKDPEGDTSVDKPAPKKKAPKKKAPSKKKATAKAPDHAALILATSTLEELEELRDDALKHTLNIGADTKEGKAIIAAYNDKKEELGG